MSVVDFLIELANSLPNKTVPGENTGMHGDIQKAMEINNSEILKSFISDKKFYANEVHVAVF
ncbi:MAG: hypothetical protein P4M12_02100 [Gammaproteobacteria bacterium]|nr:hypothetical protein [Gammaproteobacteria bacterium]